ncbi:MAG: TIM44-like domain-containing protein [Candidatus Riflebacteria bacterium]
MNKRRVLKNRILFSLSVIILLVLSVILIYETADARAGGGHNYSSGSRGRGGRSGSGGGDITVIIRLIIELLRFTYYYPQFGIPLIIVLAIGGYILYKKGDNAFMGFVISKGSNIMDEAEDKRTLIELQETDPYFNKQTFVERIKKSFVVIQDAWTKRDLKDGEFFLSDGTYEQFSIQLEELKRDHVIDYMEGLSVKDVKFLKFEKGDTFSVIHISISADGINYRKSDIDGSFLEGSKYREPFTEVWTLIRRTGAKTTGKPGLMEGNCPNCGNPVKVGRLTKCDVCNSVLRSGQHDWVLTKITQRSAWKITSDAATVLGYKKYKIKDPSFNVQHIEDKVSVMFWRKITSEKLGDISFLKKIAQNKFCDREEALYKISKNDRVFHTRCGVGSISLLGVGNFGAEDKAFAEVVWSGIPTLPPKSAGTSSAKTTVKNYYSGNRTPINHTQIFVLTRKADARTSPDGSLNSAHCPNCGAPESKSSANECNYCGTVMNSGEKDWVLEDVVSSSDSNVRKLIMSLKTATTTDKPKAYSPIKSSVSGLEMIRWAIGMMLADGKVEQSEIDYIGELSQKYSITKKQISDIIQEISSQPNPVDYVMKSSTVTDYRELFRCLIQMAMADGKISKEEMQMLKEIAKTSNMSESEFNRILQEEKKSLYKASFSAIIEARKK